MCDHSNERREAVFPCDNVHLIKFQNLLRTVYPFVTAHMFRSSLALSEIFGLLISNLPTNCMVYDYLERADLSKGYQNSKSKLKVTTHFSEIIELKFGKKMPYILCILKLF